MIKTIGGAAAAARILREMEHFRRFRTLANSHVFSHKECARNPIAILLKRNLPYEDTWLKPQLYEIIKHNKDRFKR